MLDLLSKNDIDLEAQRSDPAQIFRAPNPVIKMIINYTQIFIVNDRLENSQLVFVKLPKL